MLFRRSAQRAEIREKMRGGEGQAIVRRLAPVEALPSNCRLIGEIRLEPGCSIGSHEHMGETEIFYFTSGIGQVDDNGELITVGPGDVVVTGDAYHAVANAGSEPLIFTAVIIRH
jgi:mannose-6-phosphate isomerase-like protein (cupin superfamily)